MWLYYKDRRLPSQIFVEGTYLLFIQQCSILEEGCQGIRSTMLNLIPLISYASYFQEGFLLLIVYIKSSVQMARAHFRLFQVLLIIVLKAETWAEEKAIGKELFIQAQGHESDPYPQAHVKKSSIMANICHPVLTIHRQVFPGTHWLDSLYNSVI